jgi:O-antigen ligase
LQPAIYLVLAYIFITYTRLPELLPTLIGHGVRLGLLASIAALVVVILSGGLFRTLSSRIVLAFLFFTGWLCLCVPFSVWRGGSFQQLVAWSISLLTLILLAGCINGLEQCRKAMYAMAVSVLFIELLSFILGTAEHAEATGRLAFLWGTFANANDFATLLLMGLPFCLLVVRMRKGFSVLKIAAFLGLILIPITVTRTGSRGGLLALLVMFGIYFFSVPALHRIPLAVAAVLLAVAALVTSSSEALVRYKTIFQDPDGTYYTNVAEQSAALSSLTRKELFLSSVRMTFEHPITGVGPGMFQVADAKDAEERKHPASWRQTHNTFTQISSEAGFPALLFYIAALVFCFSAARRASRYAKAQTEVPYLRDMAFCLQLSVLAFLITGTFASNAYQFYFPLVAGLCAALEHALNSTRPVRTVAGSQPRTAALAGSWARATPRPVLPAAGPGR